MITRVCGEPLDFNLAIDRSSASTAQKKLIYQVPIDHDPCPYQHYYPGRLWNILVLPGEVRKEDYIIRYVHCQCNGTVTQYDHVQRYEHTIATVT